MEIRDAVTGDATTACLVLRQSISELCIADHKNDPDILAKWLGNKTTEKVAAWIADSARSLLVAVEGSDILGVGMVTDTGNIELNYVLPGMRFRGVSKAMLRALESRALEKGNRRCLLSSSETARRFYLACGFVEEGPPESVFGVRSYSMSKSLAT